MSDRDALAPYFWMLQASVVFTAMGAMTHFLGAYCYWQVVASFRAGLVFLFVAAYSLLRGKRAFVLGTRTLWIRSIAGSMSMVCTFFALTRPSLPMSVTVTITCMFPVWVALLSWPVLGERPSWQVWLAVASGSVGVWLVKQPEFKEDVAIAAALGASLFTAVAMLGLHRLREIEPQAIVVHFSAVATCFCVSSFFLFNRKPPEKEADLLSIALLLLGIGVTASLGQVFLTLAFSTGHATRVAVVALTQVVFALVPDLVLFHHSPDPLGLLGIVLIALPTGWVMLGPHPPALTSPPPE